MRIDSIRNIVSLKLFVATNNYSVRFVQHFQYRNVFRMIDYLGIMVYQPLLVI